MRQKTETAHGKTERGTHKRQVIRQRAEGVTHIGQMRLRTGVTHPGQVSQRTQRVTHIGQIRPRTGVTHRDK